jgi:hypothetical protein
MIELSKSPINESKLSFLVIDHDIVRLYIPMHMHDTIGVTVIESLEELK